MIYSIVLLMGSCLAYYIFSSGYDSRDIRVNAGRFLFAGSFFYIIEYTQGFCSLSSSYIMVIILYLLWVCCIPYIQYKSYKHKGSIAFCIDNSREIIVGLLMVSCLIFVNCISSVYMVKYASFSETVAVFILFSIIPVFYIVHYAIYGICPVESSIKAICETYWIEVKEYIFSYMNLSKIAIVMIGIVIFLEGVFYCFYINVNMRSDFVYIYLVLLACNIFLISKSITKIRLYCMYRCVKERVKMDSDYKIYASERKVELNDSIMLPDILPGCVIFVIGESASRDYMHACNPECKFENTPCMTKMMASDEMMLFTNVFACYNQTSEVLKRVLKEMSQYNDVEFTRAASLVDVAKKRSIFF